MIIEDYILWLVIMVLFLIAEALTMGLYTIWFAVGALVALIVSLFDLHIGIQIAAFLLVSVGCLVFVFPTIKSKLNFGKEKTNAAALIEQTGVVIETIDNMKPQGLVKVAGQTWTARSVEDKVIEVGTKVIIEEIQGVKLMVRAIQ